MTEALAVLGGVPGVVIEVGAGHYNDGGGVGPGGVADCFRCHSGAPCRGMDSRLRGNDGGG